MKRAFLQGLGLEKEVIDQILDVAGSDIEAVKAQIASVEKERDDAKKALKEFDGVDIKKLQEAEKTLKSDYENKLLNMERNTFIEKELGNAKAKHPDLLMAKIDLEKITKDKEGKFTGHEEIIKGLKETYADQFGQAVKGTDPANPETGKEPTFNFGWQPETKTKE